MYSCLQIHEWWKLAKSIFAFELQNVSWVCHRNCTKATHDTYCILNTFWIKGTDNKRLWGFRCVLTSTAWWIYGNVSLNCSLKQKLAWNILTIWVKPFAKVINITQAPEENGLICKCISNSKCVFSILFLCKLDTETYELITKISMWRI